MRQKLEEPAYFRGERGKMYTSNRSIIKWRGGLNFIYLSQKCTKLVKLVIVFNVVRDAMHFSGPRLAGKPEASRGKRS